MESPVKATEPVIPGAEFQEPESLIPCSLCNRKFVPESLVRHRRACEKVLMKKRKQFDSAKQRLTGELAECLPLPMTKIIKRASPIRKSSRWKEKHLQLLETLRAAREGSAAPSLSKPADHEQCPHCGRSFGPKAFDRHVEYCKEKFSRLENVKPNISLQAKERLEARTKYRAPCVKSKRSITREKYLPPNKREPSPTGNNVTSPVGIKPTEIKRNSLSNTKENINTTAVNSNNKSLTSSTHNTSNFVRSNLTTSSFRSSQRRPSNKSIASTGGASIVVPVQKPAVPVKQPLGPKSLSGNAQENALQQQTEHHPVLRQTLQTLPSNMKIKKELINSREEMYDPFASAEKQMKELLSFSLKTEKIEPSFHKPIFLKALPLPYYDTPKDQTSFPSSNPTGEILDNSQNKSICSIDSVLSKSGSQNSLDQSIASLENFLNQSNSSTDQLLDHCNGNSPIVNNKSSPVKATRTKSVDYITQAQFSPASVPYARSHSVTTPADPSLASVHVNFEQMVSSVAPRSSDSLSTKSSGSKRSTLNSPDLIERPSSVHSQNKSVDNLSDVSRSSLESGRRSAESGRKSSSSLFPTEHPSHVDKCSSPFDHMLRSGPNTTTSLDTILGRSNTSLDEFTHEELLMGLSTSQQCSRKSSVCSDCSQIISSRKNSSAGFLPDIARCGAKEPVVSRDREIENDNHRRENSSTRRNSIDRSVTRRNSVDKGTTRRNSVDRGTTRRESIDRDKSVTRRDKSSNGRDYTDRNVNRSSNISTLSMSSGDDPHHQGRLSGGSLEPLRRSTSLFDPPMKHPARHKPRGKQSADESATSFPKLDINKNRSVDRNNTNRSLGDGLDTRTAGDTRLDRHMRLVADDQSLDLVEQELLQSVSEFEKIFDLSSSLYSSPYANSTMTEQDGGGGDLFGGEKERGSRGNKAAGDSAYNSLSRKGTDLASSSNSSGSESSFPTQPDVSRSVTTKFSKFCHECGTQYPLSSAKFCCQCGVRRLVLA